MQGSVEWTCIKKILWILLLCIECMPMKGVNDWLHKCRWNVVMYGMNALRWVHVKLWITNSWNDELMIILEPFQRLLWMQDSHDQLAARNTLLESKVVWMIRLWSKEYLTTSFNCMNDMTIPCNVSMMMIARSKWALRTLMWLTFEVFEFYKFWKCFSDGCSNEIVYAYLPSVWLMEAHVSGRLFWEWHWEVRSWPMLESTIYESLLKLNCEFQILLTTASHYWLV